jgi:transcriptional regulator with XRE-family HTH domain
VSNKLNRKGISQREFARRKGVSSAAISSALLTNRIQKLEDGSIDWDTQADAWENNVDQNKRAAYQKHKDFVKGEIASSQTNDPEFIKKALQRVEEGTATSLESKYVKDLFAARTQVLEYREKRKELVNMKNAEAVFFSVARSLRDQLQNIEEETSGKLVGKTRDEIRSILKKEIDSILSDIQIPKIK